MKTADLARALKISTSMVRRLVRKGMPTSDVAAAQAWRRENTDPARAKVPPPRLSDHYHVAQSLGMHLGGVLARGEDTSGLIGPMRIALRALPPREAEELKLPMPVWLALTADVREAMEMHAAPGDVGKLDEEEAGAMSKFWMGVAGGDVRRA